MISSMKEMVVIKPGGLIEIRNPNLPEGAVAEVIVLLDETAKEPIPSPLSQFFGRVKGCFQNGPEADEFLRAERDAWKE